MMLAAAQCQQQVGVHSPGFVQPPEVSQVSLLIKAICNVMSPYDVISKHTVRWILPSYYGGSY